MANQYYILPNEDKDLCNCKDVMGEFENARQNLAKTKFVTKTISGVYDAECLKPHKPYSHKEILVEMAKPEWTPIEN
jgi:hypothetical protein